MSSKSRRRPAPPAKTAPLHAYLARTLREDDDLDDLADAVEAGMLARAIADGYDPMVVRFSYRLWLATTPLPDDLPLTQTTQEAP